MTEPAVEDLRSRLERERAEADRLYNAALTALDAAVQKSPRLPGPPAEYDAAGLAAVNRAWDILPDGAPRTDRSLKGRLRGFIWRLVGPPLESQRQFNASIVDHLNRNVKTHHEVSGALAETIDQVREQSEALVRFQSLLVQYLQTITLFVDSRDRALGTTDVGERLAITEQRLLAMKRDVERLGPGSAPPGTPVTVTATVEAATYVGFEDRFRGS